MNSSRSLHTDLGGRMPTEGAVSNDSKRILKIFVASPGDVRKEREALVRVISELNQTLTILAPEKGLALELVRWETHVAPGLGDDAQERRQPAPPGLRRICWNHVAALWDAHETS